MTTILIVEDNDLNLKRVRELLHRAGYNTLEAEDADTGIRIAREQIPSLILMDMSLPIRDGYEATRILKADPATRKIPVIAFTTLAMEPERKKAFASGCDGFISKPVDVERFVDTMAAYLKDAEGNNELNKPIREGTGTETVPALREKPSLEAEIDQEIEEFFMMASHDLQAPLRKIDQFVNMLKRSTTSDLSSHDFEILDRIERSSQQMHDLIADMRAFSQVNSKCGAFRLVDLFVTVREVVRDYQATLDKLAGEVRIGEMAALKADPVQLHRLFRIFIGNSLKFHRQGVPPVVRIESRLTPRFMPKFCEITIADNGIGFNAAHLEKIFKPFVRLHGASSKYTGRGMGLAIAHKIVQRHGGSIQAETVPNSGATFTIVLPLR